MKLNKQHLYRLIEQALLEHDIGGDKVYDAVKDQVELIADECMHIWAERKPENLAHVDDSLWYKQVEIAAEALKSQLPIDTILATINKVERELLNGKFDVKHIV